MLSANIHDSTQEVSVTFQERETIVKSLQVINDNSLDISAYSFFDFAI